MPKLVVVTREGAEHTLEGLAGSSVMEVIHQAGVQNLFAICGGCCSCGTCHVYVNPEDLAKLPPRSDDEMELLEALPMQRETSRLSCQLTFTEAEDGLRVTVAPQE